jgi:hypothetical protein
MRRALPLLLLLAGCDQCQQNPAAPPGNLDRVSDAVLVIGDNGHAYVVTANPELQGLRVRDLTANAFLQAPNLFFPATIATGPATTRLAAAPDLGTRVFALDADLDQVRVVRTVETGFEAAFVPVGDPVAVGPAPSGIGAFHDGDVVELWVALPEESAVQVVTIELATSAVVDDERVELPEGAHPDEIGVDPFGDAVVVTDASLASVHVIARAERALDRSLDVGGPQGKVAVGVVDVGDGLAPVALVLSREKAAAHLVRLFRPGFREPRYEVRGGVELPAFPMAAYVPDQREPQVTVCCRGLSSESVNRGEATDAWAAVGMANGRVLYLSLAAPTDDPARRLVRLIDDDPAGVSGSVDLNATPTLWAPPPGAVACSQGCGSGFVCDPNSETCVRDRRPTVRVEPRDTFGAPPFVELVPSAEQLLLTWEGALPGLSGVRCEVTLLSSGAALVVTAVEPAARGAQLGDYGVITSADFVAGCAERVIRAEIVALEGSTVTLAGDDFENGIDPTDRLCLQQPGEKRLTVEARDAFVVVNRAGDFLGRLGFDGEVEIAGGAVTVEPNPNGLPERGSRLAVPLDPHVTPIGLSLSEAPGRLGTGGFGAAGLLPTAIVGGLVDFRTPQIPQRTARRMVITTAADGQVSNTMFVCDEAETIARACQDVR